MSYEKNRYPASASTHGKSARRAQQMNFWLGIAGVVTFALFALVGTFIITGPERIWNIFGPPDLGAISFETLKRRSTPNDALSLVAVVQWPRLKSHQGDDQL